MKQEFLIKPCDTAGAKFEVWKSWVAEGFWDALSIRPPPHFIGFYMTMEEAEKAIAHCQQPVRRIPAIELHAHRVFYDNDTPTNRKDARKILTDLGYTDLEYRSEWSLEHNSKILQVIGYKR